MCCVVSIRSTDKLFNNFAACESSLILHESLKDTQENPAVSEGFLQSQRIYSHEILLKRIVKILCIKIVNCGIQSF
jgi:hypothetical protein